MSAWILLRGLTREARHWGGFEERLRGDIAGTEPVMLLDLPGNGTAAAMRAPARVADMTAFVRAQAAQQGHTPPYSLIAMSLGGMVATHWAQQHPDEVKRLVLINTSMRPFSAFHQRLRPQTWFSLVRTGAAWGNARHCERFIHGLTCNRVDTLDADLAAWAEIRRTAPVSASNGLRQLLAAARFVADKTPPRCPALILSSKADRLVDRVCSARVASHWKAPHVEHAWAGHDLPHDDAAWTRDAIVGWMAGSTQMGEEI